MADDTDAPRGLAGHLKDALTGAFHDVADAQADRKKQHVADVLEQFEADLGPMLAPLIAHALDNPETPEHFKPVLREAANPEHFSGSLFIGVAAGAILGPVLGSALEPYIQGIANAAWANNPSRPIPVDVLVATVLKGIQGVGGAAPEAAQSGISQGKFATMVDAAGQSMGIEQALLLERRNQFVGITLDDVLKYSNINPRFYASIANLKYAPLSVGEAVTAALKGHMSDGDAAIAVGLAGIDPVHFPVLKASAGRPLGLEEMLHLWNRNVMSEADVDAGVRQSDINDTYLPFAKELRHYYPPPRSLVPMLKANAITDAQFTTWMSYYGAPQDVVDAFRKEAHSAGSGSVKELSQAQTARVYSNRLIDRPTAEGRLTALGYPGADANLILDLADNARTERLLTATINKIGALYVAHKMTKPAAAVSLNAAHVPAAAQTDLFALWDVERDANLHYPTTAAVVGALRRGLIDPKETYQRLTQLGVQVSDLMIVVGDGWPPTAPQDAQAAATAVIHQTSAIPGGASGPGSAAKHLTASQISRLYSAGTLTLADAVTQLVALGYTAADARELLTLVAAPA